MVQATRGTSRGSTEGGVVVQPAGPGRRSPDAGDPIASIRRFERRAPRSAGLAGILFSVLFVADVVQHADELQNLRSPQFHPIVSVRDAYAGRRYGGPAASVGVTGGVNCPQDSKKAGPSTGSHVQIAGADTRI